VARRARRGVVGNRGGRAAGQALVEFAIVLPLFLLLLAGIIDFGLGLSTYLSVISGTREGARLAVTACNAGPCTAAVRARVVAASGNAVQSADVLLSCYQATDTTFSAPYVCDNAAVPHGDSVRVTSTAVYRMIWPLAFGNQISLGTSIVMVVE
jgi:Flp pilus assembly protein TadG